MSQRALVSSAPAPFLRRVFDWWLAQMKHALPPTIFFFFGFNLILLTKRLILQEHGVELNGFLAATLAALLVGKGVLVTDNLPFMHRFDAAPMVQPILFKSAIYWARVLVVRLAEGLVHFLSAGGLIAVSLPRRLALFLGALFVNSDMVDGPYSLSTSRYTNSTCSLATVNFIACSSAGARPRPSLPAVSAFACSPV